MYFILFSTVLFLFQVHSLFGVKLETVWKDGKCKKPCLAHFLNIVVFLFTDKSGKKYNLKRIQSFYIDLQNTS